MGRISGRKMKAYAMQPQRFSPMKEQYNLPDKAGKEKKRWIRHVIS
ncbi:hypothetical protein M1B74_05255 [Bacteroides pyogenes]